MIGLPRLGASPCKWRLTVENSLPDPTQFWAQGAIFEALPRGDAARELGFYKYAPTVLAARTKAGVAVRVFPPVWNHKLHGIRTVLIGLARQKCVYCEAAPSDREKQIDHFQPKSLFPTLAYELWNLFLSCGSCNVEKLDAWPLAGGYVRPDDGDPSARFVFGENGSVTAVSGDVDADNTVRDLALDRKEYRGRRCRAIKPRLRTLRAVLLLNAPMRKKRSLIRTLLARPEEPYSEAINQCVRRAWDAAFPGIPLG